MKSKTSFFDRAVFLRALRTAALPAALYTFLLIFLLPAPLSGVLRGYHPEQFAEKAMILTNYIYSILTPTGIFTFLYGLILAWLLYFWTFRTNTAYRYAAMPVRREALFCTNFVTGLLAFLVPHMLIAVATFAVSVALGYPQALACAQWFAVASCECLFFFSFAVLMAMIVGQMAAMPVVYVILNCAVYVLGLIISTLLENFVYGMPPTSEALYSIVGYFSPLAALFLGRGPRGTLLYPEGVNGVVPALANAWYAYALGAVGVLCALAALLLYKKREMERCGDVVAVKSLRPLFLYAFTFGCAFVISTFIMGLLNMDVSSQNVWRVLLFLLIGAFIGYFCAQMMLQKTVRVFKRGWVGFGVSCAVLALVIGLFAFDVTGYETRVPDADEVKTVSLNGGRYTANIYPTADETAIADAIHLHETIIAQKDAQQALAKRNDYRSYDSRERVNSRYMTLTYTLKNGSTLSRSYPLYAESGCKDENNPLVLYAKTYNSLSYVMARKFPPFEMTAERVATCEITGYDMDGLPKALNLSSGDAYTFLTQCVLPDLEDSALGREDFSYLEGDAGYQAAAAEVYTEDEATIYNACSLDFTYRDNNGEPWMASPISVTSDASRTVAYLNDLGFNTDFGYLTK